ncbi:MAG: basic amino acid/polyamine antiporter, family [Solirubrobacteraceae bacterium]|jgi:APA family basic amino acid/polyamine antiporter|nr:basic amino acid/polyamine antiporter, family [Solirubrobacteraceae bacterium]
MTPDGAPPAILRRSLGSPALFAVVYSTLAAGLYFSLGAVAGRALGLTPVVFLIAALFFVLCVMTYVEGASLHQERAGATVFARYAFNELWSFVAGWAILLDFVILIAITAHTATNYLGAFWGDLQHGLGEGVVEVGIVVFVAVVNVMGVTAARLRRLVALTVADLVVQILVVVLGAVLVVSFATVFDGVDLGRTPGWSDVVFALAIAAAAACTGLDASSGLAGEVAIGRRGLRRLVTARALTVVFLYVGVSLVALSAVPVVNGATDLGGRYLDAPLLGVVGHYEPGTWLSDAMRYLVGGVGAMVLIAGANSSMLGLSRLAYSLATNRQIPSLVGRLHPRRATPYVVITIAALLAIALVVPADLDFMVGMYAFGATLALTIAHLAVIVLRYREPDRDRPYRMPLNVGRMPLPAALGALLSFAGWIGVLATHAQARVAGLVWMALGLLLYVVYRTTEGKPLLRRVTIPATALSREREEAEYGSILVPLLGTPLDDDIVQTAGRLAGADPDEGESAAVIEALWVFQMPMSLPLDAALPEAQLQEARRALARAKAVGEEYEGVEVATATVRSRRVGQAIVEEARRRGVEAIVLAAEPPSRIRGGALLGGRGGPLDNYVGEVTRHVIDKAPCRVILTAPPADAMPEPAPEPAPDSR